MQPNYVGLWVGQGQIGSVFIHIGRFAQIGNGFKEVMLACSHKQVQSQDLIKNALVQNIYACMDWTETYT